MGNCLAAPSTSFSCLMALIELVLKQLLGDVCLRIKLKLDEKFKSLCLGDFYWSGALGGTVGVGNLKIYSMQCISSEKQCL